jgi:hypothetical protein
MGNGIAHANAVADAREAAAEVNLAQRLVIVGIVCFLDEEEHLAQTLASLAAQSRTPDTLLLVDDGSSDDSPRLARAFAQTHAWARLVSRPRRARERDRLASAAELHAFQSALGEVRGDWDVLAKLDSDIRFNPRLFETIERRFLADRRLGIAGAYLAVLDTDGELVRERCPPEHVRGATKFYRRECFEAISPVPAILGWDTIDEISARMRGWRTATFGTPGGDSLHMRQTATVDGTLRGYRRFGECAWGYGAHPLHVALGTCSRLARPPRMLGGINYALGWASAGLRGAPRASPNVRAFGRREQLRGARALIGLGARDVDSPARARHRS